MTRVFRLWAVVLTASLGVAGCGSARLGGGPVVASARPSPVPVAPDPVVPSVPSGSVTTEPLPPPPGASGGGAPGPGPVVADVPSTPSLPPVAPPVTAVPSGPSRSASVGSYTARDASGATCHISLTGSPALDLYRASSSGCTNKDLGRVTAWDFREGEVYLYQPGGAVAARLRGSGSSLSGVLAKSGAPLTLER